MKYLYNRKKIATRMSAPGRIFGITLIGTSLMLIPCLIFAINSNESIDPFLWPAIIGFVIGLASALIFKMPNTISPTNALLMIGVVWFTCIGYGTLPFIIAGMPVVDAIFESASGFTTTGASIMSDIESWDTGILLWRSVTNGIGGIITVIVFLLLFPLVGYGDRTFFTNELSGSGESDNFSMKIRTAAKQFIMVYVILIGILAIILLVLGVSLLETLCISFSAISTGGFMCLNDSVAGYSSLIKIVITLFMFLGGTNFYLQYRGMKNRNIKEYFRNEEFRTMAIWFAFISVVIFFIVFGNSIFTDIGNTFDNFVNVALNVVSAGTNTGFAASDFAQWPAVAAMLLFIITLIGGSSGSTSGGIKIFRAIVVFKSIKNGLKKLIVCRGVFDIKLQGNSVGNDNIISSMNVIFLFLLTILIGAVLIALTGVDVGESFALVTSCITNYGPGLGIYGPMGSFSELEPIAKIILSAIMWIGRLEVIMAIILFTPGFWRVAKKCDN